MHGPGQDHVAPPPLPTLSLLWGEGAGLTPTRTQGPPPPCQSLCGRHSCTLRAGSAVMVGAVCLAAQKRFPSRGKGSIGPGQGPPWAQQAPLWRVPQKALLPSSAARALGRCLARRQALTWSGRGSGHPCGKRRRRLTAHTRGLPHGERSAILQVSGGQVRDMGQEPELGKRWQGQPPRVPPEDRNALPCTPAGGHVTPGPPEPQLWDWRGEGSAPPGRSARTQGGLLLPSSRRLSPRKAFLPSKRLSWEPVSRPPASSPHPGLCWGPCQSPILILPQAWGRGASMAPTPKCLNSLLEAGPWALRLPELPEGRGSTGMPPAPLV